MSTSEMSQKPKTSRRAYVFRFAAKNGHRRSVRLTIVGAAASTAIRADLPTPSNEMHVTTSGGSMRSRLPFAGPLQTCHKGKKKKTGPFVVRRP